MKKISISALLALAILVAATYSCKVHKSTETAKAPAPDPCATLGVTYRAKMKSIIDAKCAGCHKSGSKAGYNGKIFTLYNDMKDQMNGMYHEAIETKEMPPQKATQLTEEEMNLWKCWQKAGFPEQLEQKNNALHGVTLEMMLHHLVGMYGWKQLGEQINIRCFQINPDISSSLKFLRKTPWARKKVEELYVYSIQ